METWKTIEGFENYEVSTWGNIRGKYGVLKPYKNKKGYLKVGLYKDGKNNKKRVNRLVAQAFIPNPHCLPQVNHKDGNKLNNSYTNLEWVTNEENCYHAKRMRELANEANSCDR